MRRILAISVLLLAALAGAGAQGRVVERTYISTDKDVYVAGDQLWYSAFCVDASAGNLSGVSSVAYIELHGPAGMVASGKVALSEGRGAGRLQIPGTLATGNYRLVAYTAQNEAEKGYDFNGLASKTISVFNVLSNDRVEGGVEIVEDPEYAGVLAATRPAERADGLRLEWRDSVLTVVNLTGNPASLSLSVYHDDGIITGTNPGISDFLSLCGKVGKKQFDDSVLPEYEGEIIRGHITGFSQEMVSSLVGKYAFISTPSEKSDVYSSVIDDAGRVAFFTGNIYGNKEYICEIEGINPSLSCYVELESPFVAKGVEKPRALKIAPSLRDALQLRSAAMQIERRYTADTLFDVLEVRNNHLFGNDEIAYPLDDYTRFPTMAEVFVEFIPEIRARRWSDGTRNIQVRLGDASDVSFSREKTLMLLDGVPVFDQQKIMDYDPLLVESVNIYPSTYFIGTRSFEGVVNFVTYKHNMPGFQFGGNVRIIDYQGVSWPMAATGAGLSQLTDYPDYRQTIYWHPLLECEADGTIDVQCKKPDYKGRFMVVAEGISADGKPLEARTWIVLQ